MSEFRTYRPIYNPNSIQLDIKVSVGYKIADLHLHTNWSDGTVSPEKMVDIALLAGISAIAITDHNISGSSDISVAYARRNNLPIEVIRGTEISSKDGHVLALNLDGDIKPNMPLIETIRQIHSQNGFAIIAHPHLAQRSSVPLELIGKIINSDDPELYIDGVEIFNATEERIHRVDKSGIFFGDGNSNVRKFVDKNIHNPKLGALLGNTDGHTMQIGYGITVYGYESILDAIRNRDIIVMSANTSFWEDFSESARMTYSIIRSHITGTV